MMTETETLVVGASVSGLAVAACLQKQGIEYTIIEKQSQVAAPWRTHYERLHLHTNKRLSNLPYKKFDHSIPRYPSRQQVMEYLEDYQKVFNINPVFNTEAKGIRKENDCWITETSTKTFKSKYIIVATGLFNKPKSINFKGMETFPGTIIHSSEYKSGRDFKGQKVLVVGFGNSACEIAIDLYEQGAAPSMAVRSPINIVPRAILGVPILEISLLMRGLPPRIADSINAPLLRLLLGDITKLGLHKMPYGPLEEIQRNRNIPVLDIGTIKHIRQGHISVYGDITRVEGNTVQFSNGKKQAFDSIVAAIGYNAGYAEMIQVDESRLGIDREKYFGKDGLYFCGFWVSATGQIREIARDALKIAKDICGRM